MSYSQACYCCQNAHLDHCAFCLAKCPRALKERQSKTSAEVIDLRKKLHKAQAALEALESRLAMAVNVIAQDGDVRGSLYSVWQFAQRLSKDNKP